MVLKSIQEAWDQYRGQVLEHAMAGAPEEIMFIMRSTFFTGAYVLFTLLDETMTNDSYDTEFRARVLAAVHEEMKKFTEDSRKMDKLIKEGKAPWKFM